MPCLRSSGSLLSGYGRGPTEHCESGVLGTVLRVPNKQQGIWSWPPLGPGALQPTCRHGLGGPWCSMCPLHLPRSSAQPVAGWSWPHCHPQPHFARCPLVQPTENTVSPRQATKGPQRPHSWVCATESRAPLLRKRIKGSMVAGSMRSHSVWP